MLANQSPQRVRWWLVAGAVIAGLLIIPSGVAAQQATVTTDGPATATAGETITVSVTLTNTKSSQENYIADVSLPEGWTVESHTDDGGTWNGGDVSWLWQNIPANSSVTPTLAVTIPAETSGGSDTIDVAAKSKGGTEDTAIYTVDISASGGGSGSSDENASGDSETGTNQGDTQTNRESSESDNSQGDSGTESSSSSTQTVHAIKDSSPGQPGTTVDTSETLTVEQVSFDSESIDGELEISAYQNIPKEVSAEISEDISQDLSPSEDSDSVENGRESLSATGTSVITVADISPPAEASNVAASVTFSVSRDKITTPEQAVITHKRDTGWHRLQTEVVSTTPESIRLKANTRSFSFFAVVEETNRNTATTEQSSAGESLSDRLPTFHLTGLVFALVSVVLLKQYRF